MQFFRKIVVGWDGVDGHWDTDGKEVAWDDGNFDGACNDVEEGSLDR